MLVGALSIIALLAWLGANSPLIAILLLAVADLLATLPTIIKAWKYPETETIYTSLNYEMQLFPKMLSSQESELFKEEPRLLL